MKIEFIKDHELGIVKGHIVENAKSKFAKRMIDEGYAKEVKSKKTEPKEKTPKKK